MQRRKIIMRRIVLSFLCSIFIIINLSACERNDNSDVSNQQITETPTEVLEEIPTVIPTEIPTEIPDEIPMNSTVTPTATTANNSDDINTYVGKWYSEDYKQYKDVGEHVFSGSELTINISENGNGNIQIKNSPTPPPYTYALISAEFAFTGEKADFQFEDDEWGNAGTGTITFYEDKLIVDISLEGPAEGDNHIFTGEIAFYKNIGGTPEVTPANLPSDSSAAISIKDYEGTWYSENYVDEDDSGSKLTIEADSDTEGKIIVTCISAAPFYRIAIVEAPFTCHNSKAQFTFEDDGWGNAGTGTIIFEQDKLMVSFKFDINSYENWSMFTDVETFHK
jgi:hypothetical protein